jgi:HPt (histidine-containing phosphotransfer) domain-containing protein
MNATGHEGAGAADRAIHAALEELAETVGDRAFAGELLGDFLGGLRAQLAALQSALDADELETLHRGAHTLRSNAATFGVNRLVEACRALELAARAAGPASLRELVIRVDAEAARALPDLEAVHNELAL